MASDSLKPIPPKTFSKANRLRKRREFLKVYDERKNLFFRFAVVYHMKNGLDNNRLGLTVSKKVGGSVVRNRVKRVIKEAFRLSQANIEGRYDFVFNAKKEAARITLADALTIFSELAKRAEK